MRSLSFPRLSVGLSARLSLCLMLGLSLLSGCGSDDPAQLQTIQQVANALRVRDLATACGHNIRRLQDPISCDNLLMPLLHYSPGFRGAKVRRRGPSSGWRYSERVKVPVSYEGPDGSGDLDVIMHRSQGQKGGPAIDWRISLFVPVVKNQTAPSPPAPAP